MSMTTENHLLSLFEQAQDKIQRTCNSFEEHFSWLEEAIIAAKQTFYHRDAMLLPKTPYAKKRGRPKRTDSAISMDDGESPSKRSSTESTTSQTETQSPETMPRRPGRAASRIAQERVAKSFKESSVRKLRRPSTPIEATRTVKKTKTSKQMVADRESVEIISKEPKEKLKDRNSTNTEDQLLLSNKLKSLSPSHQDELKTDEVVTIKSGNSGKNISLTQPSSEEIIESYKENTDAVEEKSSERCSTTSSLVDDSPQKCYSKANEDCEKRLSIQVYSVTGSDNKKEESCKSKDTIKGTEISESAESKTEINIETGRDGKSSHEIPVEQAPPVPKTRITRTKQKEILLSSSEENLHSSDSSSATSSTWTQPVPKPRSTRTKQKIHSQAESVIEEMEAQMLPPANIPKVISMLNIKENMSKELSGSESSINAEEEGSKDDTEKVSHLSPKVRSTRTKKRIEELLNDVVVEDVTKSRSTRTKRKEEVSTENDKKMDLPEENLESDDTLSSNHSRSTRTKKRQVEDPTASQPVRSTRTKRQKMEEEASKDSDKENISCFSVSSNEFKSSRNPLTNNSIVTKSNQTVTDLVSTGNSEITIASSSEKAIFRVEKDKNAVPQSNTNSRITRSKVRQVPPAKKSPKNGSPYIKKNFRSPSQRTMSPSTPNRDPFKRDCCTPKSADKSTPKTPILSRVASPLRYSPRFVASDKTSKPVRAPFKKCDILSEVEEIASDAIEVSSSPVRVKRHSQGKAVKTPDSRWARINPQPKTPSPQCPLDKIVRPKMTHLSGSSSHGSSSRITPKTYSRIQLGFALTSSSSNDLHKTQKKMTTPNDGGRIRNIVTNVTSFIKVQPAKPTREELEEKKQLDLQKKREREEDIRKKKEELLKAKVEEQKRRNEERMRRAKELREEKERKLLEAKEQQEKDKRIRDERLKEEQNRKKNQLLAKKQAVEEVKARKLREQMEEARKAEEARKLEEARRAEEERKAEQLRLQEEEKKKRIAEAERIARERREIEQLKLREEERLASANLVKPMPLVQVVALNSTFTKEPNDDKENHSKHNGTFTKSSSSSKDRSDSYEMTPDQKKKAKKIKVKNINDYDIADIKSDDSTDDEQAPKKNIPTWAQRNQLKASLINQEYYPPDINTIFPAEELLTMPDLMKIFPIVRKRFTKRTSSAIWNTPPGKYYD